MQTRVQPIHSRCFSDPSVWLLVMAERSGVNSSVSGHHVSGFQSAILQSHCIIRGTLLVASEPQFPS